MRMKQEARQKNGEPLLLRSLCAQDAPQALALCRRVAGETLNLIRYEDEWTITVEQEAAHIKRQEDDPKALMIGAFVGETLAGIGSIAPPAPVDRARHRLSMGVCVLKAHWGRGIGTAMMRVLVEQARRMPAEQLELEVVSTNERAIRMYERFGFVEFGRHPRKLKYRDGTYADMVMMLLELRAKA